MDRKIKLVVIGGSWGGIDASLSILKGLPANFPVPVLLVLHRLRNYESDLEGIYSRKLAIKVREIDEKEIAQPGFLYIAPPNYHVLIERDLSFSLDVSEFENFSRPSIDVSFISAAEAIAPGVLGILLSGASKDGSRGLKIMADNGGTVIVQDPAEAEVATMPASAISIIDNCEVMSVKEIQEYLLALQ